MKNGNYNLKFSHTGCTKDYGLIMWYGKKWQEEYFQLSYTFFFILSHFSILCAVHTV